MQDQIDSFLERGPWAVVGASTARSKYGNKVFRRYLRAGKAPVYPVHRSATEIEGHTAYRSLSELPEVPRAISIITPPAVTEGIVDEAIALGVEALWMQPGAESAAAIERAEAAGLSVIANGPCLLVEMAGRE
ncbi:MAG: CoA-binding protein [Planctomycetota bacterium]